MADAIIVLATRNKNKIDEMNALLHGVGYTVKSAYDFADLVDVDEDQDTLEGNALKKARYTYEMTGLPSLADDTGLEVDALGGRPGVYSARYAGEQATYADNVKKLVAELGEIIASGSAQYTLSAESQQDSSSIASEDKTLAFDESVPVDHRQSSFTARFRTVLALVDGQRTEIFNGVCEGRIILSPRGERGFGYDPVFVPEGYGITFAEMDPAVKNSISHRGKAMQLFLDYLG